jgi:hypothetical protein
MSADWVFLDAFVSLILCLFCSRFCLLNGFSALDTLFDKRRQMEMHVIEGKLSREDKYFRELDELRVRYAEDYNKLKMNLEHNIQVFVKVVFFWIQLLSVKIHSFSVLTFIYVFSCSSNNWRKCVQPIN